MFVFFRMVLMTDREERSVICTCAINLSAQNSALRIATAFSKGDFCAHAQHPAVQSSRLWVIWFAHRSAERVPSLPLTGTVDIGHLPHPVLIHLRAFFDLWDAFTLQAVQSGQPYISDHIMFEVGTHLITVTPCSSTLQL